MANEYKIWNGLTINDTQSITGITNDSGLTNQSFVIPTSNAIVGYISGQLSIESSIRVSIESSLMTSISGEISTRTGADSSLTTSISGEVSTRTGTDLSLSTSLSGEISTRTGVDSSLIIALSSEISTRYVIDNDLNTTISSEISTRTGVDSSLTTSLSSEVSTRTGVDSSLTTSLSSEVSTRTGADTSLSVIVNTKLSVSGGTISPLFYLSGLTQGTTSNVIYIDSSNGKITYDIKPTGGGTSTSTSYQTTGSTTFTFIGGTGTTIDTYPNTEDFAVYYYTVMSGTTEKRSGIITINNTTSQVTMNESTTTDIGVTNIISFTTDINSGNVRLNATISSGSGTWTCKFIKNQM